jgi:Protein involved in initiation of plasmid replication
MNDAKILNGICGDHIVQKSRPLIMASDIPYTLGQLKVLDTYLSRINSHDPESTVVEFELKEYEQLLGVEKINKSSLIKSLSEIIKIQTTVPYDGNEDGVLVCNLFDGATLSTDKETGVTKVRLKCSELAKCLFFNIESLGYVKYSLKNTIMMKSSYSILLYQYLKDNAFRRNWEIDLTTLNNNILHISSSYYLRNFQKMNQKILTPIIEEINTKTDIRVKYDKVYTKGKVTSIAFHVRNEEKDHIHL